MCWNVHSTVVAIVLHVSDLYTHHTPKPTETQVGHVHMSLDTLVAVAAILVNIVTLPLWTEFTHVIMI